MDKSRTAITLWTSNLSLTLGQRIELLNTMFHLMQILVRKVIRFLFRILRSLLGELASCAPIGIKIKLLLTKIRGQVRCFLPKFLCQWKSKFFFEGKKRRLACGSHYPTPHGTVGYVYEYHQLKLEFGNSEPTHTPDSIDFWNFQKLQLLKTS